MSMKKVLGSICCLLILLVVVASARAEEPLSASKGAVEFTGKAGKGGRGFAWALIKSEKTDRVFHVCVQDTGGYIWALDISGASITGTFFTACDGCFWPVAGTHTKLKFDMTATNTCANSCYCDTAFRFYGTANKKTKTADGLADDIGCGGTGIPWSAQEIKCP